MALYYIAINVKTVHCSSCVVVPLFIVTLFQFDVREDEEQNKKYEEIIELLLAAGYFRARIKGLSPFDKVSV